VRDARWNPLREPLVHFALGALLILGAERAVPRQRAVVAPARPRIVVDADALADLRARFESQSWHRATPDEERALVDEYVRDEALAREARARHLDEGDAVIRRRLVQKMELLLEAQSVTEPTEAELTRWLDAHAAEFHRARTVSFEHVYFARSTRGDRAEPDAHDEDALEEPKRMGKQLPGRRALEQRDRRNVDHRHTHADDPEQEQRCEGAPKG